MSEESRSCRVIQGVCQRDGGAWAVDNEMTDVINRLYGNKNIVKLNNVVDKYYRRKKILCFQARIWKLAQMYLHQNYLEK